MKATESEVWVADTKVRPVGVKPQTRRCGQPKSDQAEVVARVGVGVSTVVATPVATVSQGISCGHGNP